MGSPERFSVLASFEPVAGWRRALALDRAGGAPRAVVLSFVPEAIVDDAPRFAALVRDVEAAARLHHPGVVPVLGMETVGEGLAVVEPYRPGATLRGLLALGGRLPPEIAVRVVVDACQAVAEAHALDTGDGRPLVHGVLETARISVGDDGMTAVSGFAVGGAAREPGGDVSVLAAILHECVTGEAPPDPPRALDAPGIPPELAAAVSRAIGATPEGPFPTARALAEALSAAGTLASHAAVAAYADAILPAGEEKRELLATLEGVPRPEAEEVSEDLIVDPTAPAIPAPAEAASPPASPDAVRPSPEPSAPAQDAPAPQPPSAQDAAPAQPSPPAAPPLPRSADLPPPLAPSRPAPDAATTFRAPPPPPPRSFAPVVVAAVCAAAGFAIGFVASRIAPGAFAASPPPAISAGHGAGGAPGTAAEPPAPLPAGGLKADTSRPPGPAPSRKSAKAVRGAAAAGKGMLDVTAPAEAEVFLDGRSVGKGSMRVKIAEGPHRIEVRLGPSRVAERFTLAAGETWTYAVAPAVQ